MNGKWIVALAFVGLLTLPVVGLAHEGHTHKAMGTVASVEGNHLQIKTTDGKVMMIMLDDKTAVTRGKQKLDATALKAGEKVSIDYMQEKDMNMAKTIKLGTGTTAASKK